MKSAKSIDKIICDRTANRAKIESKKLIETQRNPVSSRNRVSGRTMKKPGFWAYNEATGFLGVQKDLISIS
jgi:hypothetical protein